MTPADLAILDAVAAQCERMSIYDTQRIGVEDVHALARAIRAALARIAEMEAERDRLDCTRREGGDIRHCRLDAKCLRCRYEALEAAHVSREDREEAMAEVQVAERLAMRHREIGAAEHWLAARRLLKLEDA